LDSGLEGFTAVARQAIGAATANGLPLGQDTAANAQALERGA
jgi:hypothetical protein